MAADKETTTSETAGASAAKVDRDELRNALRKVAVAQQAFEAVPALRDLELTRREAQRLTESIVSAHNVLAAAARELLAREPEPEWKATAADYWEKNELATASEARDEAKGDHWTCNGCGRQAVERWMVVHRADCTVLAKQGDTMSFSSLDYRSAPAPPVEPRADRARPYDKNMSGLEALEAWKAGRSSPFGDPYQIFLEGWGKGYDFARFVGQPVEAAQRRPATEAELMELFGQRDEGIVWTDEMRAGAIVGYRACELRNGIAGQGEREGGD